MGGREREFRGRVGTAGGCHIGEGISRVEALYFRPVEKGAIPKYVKDLRWTGWEHARGAEAALCSAFSSPHGKFTGQIQDSTNCNVASHSKTPQTGPLPTPRLVLPVPPSAASVTLSANGSSQHLLPLMPRARSILVFLVLLSFPVSLSHRWSSIPQ